jgi:nitrogen fixation/metabolism regulation signal transduction histidine kinase
MGFKKFSFIIAVRTILVMFNLVVLTWLITSPGYHTTTFVFMALLIFQCVSLIRFVEKTNKELTRFLDAARYADYSQRFELRPLGNGFGDLSHAFTDILKRFQHASSQQEEEKKHLKAIVEHVPVPLISINNDGQLSLRNHAARKLFGTNHVTKWQDLIAFGEEFAQRVSSIQAGEQHLVYFHIDEMEHRLAISATQIRLSNRHEILISMQDIQSELDGVQLQAWQDLVKVLTHEIMNSITPVASLAKTAVDLVEDSKANVKDYPTILADLEDIEDAVQTVARRSDGLIQFVGSYRKLTRLPSPNKKPISVTKLLQQSYSLATQTWQSKGIEYMSHVKPSELEVNVDSDMLEQLLINLLQNAEHAVEGIDSPIIDVNAYLNPRGHVVIQISDNGHGIPEDVGHKVFVPFYTTKPSGSGVGLALSRQIMIAHGGTIKYVRNQSGGAEFNLTF